MSPAKLPSDRASVAVIIPTLNAGPMLGEALRSLAEQMVRCEIVLVDGGSSDDTLEVASSADGVRVISAPGTSIYEALNRGIEESGAPAICFLNADDTLLPGALAAFTDALARDPKAGLACGWPSFVGQQPGGARSIEVKGDRRALRPLTMELLLRGPCAINSLCIRRAIFDNIGLFDTAYRLAADREWMLRAWCAGVRIAEFDRPVYRYLSHEGSQTLDRGRRNYVTIRREHLAIIHPYMRNAATGRDLRFVSALKRWHAAESAMLFVALARSGAWRQAESVARGAFQARPLWPAALVADILVHITGRSSA